MEDDEEEHGDEGEDPHGHVARIDPLLHDRVGREDQEGQDRVAFGAGVGGGLPGQAHRQHGRRQDEHRPGEDVVDHHQRLARIPVHEGCE